MSCINYRHFGNAPVYQIVKKHPFLDGNKRTAMATA
ncbi:MAG: Fic family protein [Desulfobacteraceae bacterium]|nr:Fic family protein [Desulfobacteraceae bacterium]